MTPANALQPFPDDWHTALVFVPHPDDPEYGIGAAGNAASCTSSALLDHRR